MSQNTCLTLKTVGNMLTWISLAVEADHRCLLRQAQNQINQPLDRFLQGACHGVTESKLSAASN